jgi:hypothetical protein
MQPLRTYVDVLRRMTRESRAYLLVGGAFDYMWFGVYLIGFNLYMLRLGFNPELIGIVWGSAIGVYAVMTLVAGYVFPRSAVRSLVVWGVLLNAIGITVAMQPSWVIGFNCFSWVGGALFTVGRIPYLSAAAPPGRRVETFALERLWGISLGFVGALVIAVLPHGIARVLGVGLDDPGPYGLTVLTAPIIEVASVQVLVRTFRGAPTLSDGGDGDDDHAALDRFPGGSAARGSPVTKIIVFALFAAVFALATAPLYYLFSLYMTDGLAVTASITAIIMGLARFLSLPVTFLLPVLTRRWSVRWILIAIAILLGLVLVPMAVIPVWFVAGLCFLITSALMDISEPVFDVYRMESVPIAWQTRVAGTTLTASFCAQSAGGFAGGVVIKYHGYLALFLGSAVLAVAAGILLLVANPLSATMRARQP